MGPVHRRVRQRPDGLLEIRSVSWRHTLMTRNTSIIAGLVVACVVCMSMLVACLVYASLRVEGLPAFLLIGVIAVVVVAAVRAAGLTRCRPMVPPANTKQATIASKRTRPRATPLRQGCPTNICTTPP
jgi:hypothetical protein